MSTDSDPAATSHRRDVGLVRDDDWEAAGIEPDESAEWKAYGLGPRDAVAWKVLQTEPEEAATWDRRIGSPAVSQQWIENGLETSEGDVAGDLNVDWGLPDREVTPYEMYCWNQAGVEWWDILFGDRPWEDLDHGEKIVRIQQVRNAYDAAVGEVEMCGVCRHALIDHDFYLDGWRPGRSVCRICGVTCQGDGTGSVVMGRTVGIPVVPPLPMVSTEAGVDVGADASMLDEPGSLAARAGLLAQPGVQGPGGLVAKRDGVDVSSPAAAPGAGRPPLSKHEKKVADRAHDHAEGFRKAPLRKLQRETEQQRTSDKLHDKALNTVASEGLTKAADAYAPGSGAVVRPIAQKLAPLVSVIAKRGVKYPLKAAQWAAIATLAVLVVMTMIIATIFGGVGGDPQRQYGDLNDVELTIPDQYKTEYQNAAKAHGLPWTMLAGVGWVASDHGRQNPYVAGDGSVASPATATGSTAVPAAAATAGGGPDDNPFTAPPAALGVYTDLVWPKVSPSILGERGAGPMLLSYGETGQPQDASMSIDALAEEMSRILDEEVRGSGLSREQVVSDPYTEQAAAVWLRVNKRLPVDQETAARRAGLTTQGGGGAVFVGDASSIKAMDPAISDVVAQAYLNAAQKVPATPGGCQVPVELLVGIGKKETGHGTFAGTQTAADGTQSQLITGYAPVGRDTDGGRWDARGDADYAVGMMQAIPPIWVRYGFDGNGDGTIDPKNVFDATLTSARLLCGQAAQFRIDMTTDGGLREAAERYYCPALCGDGSYGTTVLGYIQTFRSRNGGGAAPSTAPAAPVVPTTTPAAPTGPNPATLVSATRPNKVIAVGDSLLAGTCTSNHFLQSMLEGVQVICDARVGRPTSEGIQVLRGLAGQIDASTVVLIVLGHNDPGPDWSTKLDQLLQVAAPAQKIVVMTNTPGVPQAPGIDQYVNPAIKAAAAANPKVVVADWAAAATADPSLVASDKLHAANYQALARILVEAVLNGAAVGANTAASNQSVMSFEEAVYLTGKVYSGLEDPSVLKRGANGPGGTAGMSLATAGTYTTPVAKDWLAAHTNEFTKPHHDYPAMDIGVTDGNPVYSVTNGVVLTLSGGGCGNGITIKGDDNMYYVYCHGTEVLAKQGDRVTVGQQIMISGHTGHVIPAGPAGAHLHFQINDPANSQIKLCPHPTVKAWFDGIPRIPNISQQAECPPGQSGVQRG